MADVHSKLDELSELVTAAKGVPLSASCVLHRSELLAAIDEVRRLLPGELAAAGGVLRESDELVAAARAEAEHIVIAAKAERDRLVSSGEVLAHGRREADRVVATARKQAENMRAEVEDYVDGKLANFEVVLHRTIAAVERGRDKLRVIDLDSQPDLVSEVD